MKEDPKYQDGQKAESGVIEKAENQLDKEADSNPSVAKRVNIIKDARAEIDKNSAVRWYKRMLTTPSPIKDKKLPIGVKIFGLLCMLAAAYGLVETGISIFGTIHAFISGDMDVLGISTIVVVFIHLIDLALLAIAFLAFGIRLFRGQRVYAALVIYGIYILTLGGAICSLMLFGVSLRLLVYVILLVILIAFQIYLDPYLREERQLQRLLRNNELKHEQEEGMLGRDRSGKGYIKLDFFNLFWIFVICSIIGDAMESVFHVLVVDPGHWQDRAGLLFGPFSPIYGCGALLMTLFLNRLYKKNIFLIFILSAIIGGLFEAFVSVFMQYTFGAVAWNYSGTWWCLPLLGGRTCGIAMAAWGALGVIWLKLLLPFMLWLIDKIPWNWRYTVTSICAVLMAVDCVMSLQALDCWYDRLSHHPIDSPIQKFYSEYFDNQFMQNRFQSMTVNPDSAVRGGQ